MHGDEFVWDEFVVDELFGEESSGSRKSTGKKFFLCQQMALYRSRTLFHIKGDPTPKYIVKSLERR